MAGELAQTLVVTAVALGAVGLLVRRAILRKKKQLQAPGVAGRAVRAARPSRG